MKAYIHIFNKKTTIYIMEKDKCKEFENLMLGEWDKKIELSKIVIKIDENKEVKVLKGKIEE